jgi:hypothetical protein
MRKKGYKNTFVPQTKPLSPGRNRREGEGGKGKEEA